MPELEALAEIRATPGGHSVVPGQYTWRYAVPEHKPIRLGSDAAQSEWVVPEDRMISRFHATLEWDGAKLTVSRRPVTVEFPKPPQNHIWFRNNPVEKCEVRPGECFVIGQTRFTLRGDAEPAPASPVDATAVHRQVEYTRAELESFSFSDPATFLRAMEQLPNVVKFAQTEAGLFRQVLKVALAGLPKADAGAVVRLVPDPAGGEARVAVVEQNVRTGSAAHAENFAPSRKLVRKAARDKKSCLHVWSTDPNDIDRGAGADHSMTIAMHHQGYDPWAACTPFQDGSPFALYLTGKVRAESSGGGKLDVKMLTDCQKFAEILVGLVEATRHKLKLIRQNTVLRDMLPSGVRKHLDDPDQFDALIKPQEREVTVLFCDLRNYSGYAEQRGATLHEAWKEIADTALETMSSTITMLGGIVSGFRGDAVLGFWGWPDTQADQAAKAAEAALRIHEKLHGRAIQKKCGLGLTHGPALAGRMGAFDLAVLDLYGPVVNLAFRLEEMTKAFGVGVVISEELANRLSAADPRRWRMRSLGRVRPKGMKPVTAYELATPGGGSWVGGDWYHAGIGAWDEALQLFTDGHWADARDALAMFGGNGDTVAECILAHIDRTRCKPPPDWDGSFAPRPPGE